jgi:hypothetical protein
MRSPVDSVRSRGILRAILPLFGLGDFSGARSVFSNLEICTMKTKYIAPPRQLQPEAG